VSADATYSSFNTLNTRGTVSGGAGNLGYMINFGNRKSDGFLRNNYWDGMDYSGRLDYDLSKRGSLSASFKRSELDHGFPVVNDPDNIYSDYDPDYPTVTEDADTIRMGRLISYPGGKSFKKKKATHFDLGYEQHFKQSNLSISFSRIEARKTATPISCQKVTGTDFSGWGDRKEKTSGIMFDYQTFRFVHHAFSIGYSHRRMQVANMPDIYRIQGGYIEDQYDVTNKFILNLGLRYVHVRELSYPYADPGTTASYRHKVITKLFPAEIYRNLPVNPETRPFSQSTGITISGMLRAPKMGPGGLTESLGTETSLSYGCRHLSTNSRIIWIYDFSQLHRRKQLLRHQHRIDLLQRHYAYTIDSMKFYGAELEFNWTPFKKLAIFGNYSFLKNKFSTDADLPYAVLLRASPETRASCP